MNYIVFDLEWNQPVDGMSSEERELLFEVIEIGAVKLDSNRNIISEFSQLVKPVVYKQLNWHIKKMLGLSMKELMSDGLPFPEVMNNFLKWCGDDAVFCSWGSQDLTELQRNMHYYKMEPLADGPISFFNVQKLYAMQMKEENITRNLEYAVSSLNIKKDIPFHRAYSDSYYTAKIFKTIDKKIMDIGVSFDIYHLPKNNKQEIFITQGKETYFLSRAYEDRQELVENRKVLAMNCALCNKRSVRPKIRWFVTGTRYYLGGAICDIHGPIKAKLRIRKNEFGQYYAEKFLEYCSMDSLNDVKNKKHSMKKESSKQ